MAKSKDKSKVRPTSYWHESKRPLVCLAFVAPMLLIYECGILVLGPQAMRNGVEVYLRNFLSWIGFGQYILLPVLTTAILLGWHHVNGERWRFRGRVLGGMLVESLVLAFILLTWARFQSNFFSLAVPLAAPDGQAASRFAEVGRFIGYFGAGIYEELLFRLMLLPASVGVIAYCGASRRASLITAVIFTSLVFSAAHYQIFTFNNEADAFAWFSFLFRFLAGVFFCLLFLFRGFGVAVGAHAIYDIFSRSDFF